MHNLQPALNTTNQTLLLYYLAMLSLHFPSFSVPFNLSQEIHLSTDQHSRTYAMWCRNSQLTSTHRLISKLSLHALMPMYEKLYILKRKLENLRNKDSKISLHSNSPTRRHFFIIRASVDWTAANFNNMHTKWHNSHINI